MLSTNLGGPDLLLHLQPTIKRLLGLLGGAGTLVAHVVPRLALLALVVAAPLGDHGGAELAQHGDVAWLHGVVLDTGRVALRVLAALLLRTASEIIGQLGGKIRALTAFEGVEGEGVWGRSEAGKALSLSIAPFNRRGIRYAYSVFHVYSTQ